MKDEKDMINEDFSKIMKNGKWVKASEFFEMKPKDKTITLRINSELFESIKLMAKEKDISYQKLIRLKLGEILDKAP